jgi:fido (protein-threonine AMPylation protein)
VHVEVRVQGSHRKYYLALSYRSSGRVRKARVYLGADLSRRELDAKRREAEPKLLDRGRAAKALRDPFVSALTPSELKELATLEPAGTHRVLHLSDLDWAQFTQAFAYDTNAIEGSQIRKEEVAGILRKRRWPEERSKEDLAETYGVAEAVEYIRKTEEHLSIGLIRRLHRIVFRNSKPFAGELRRPGEEVAVTDATGRVVHQGAPSGQIGAQLRELVRWYSLNRGRYPPLVLAAVVHNRFEGIHPFRDGNGRVGRLLLNNILVRHGLPPVNIELRNRAQYYAALKSYQVEDDIRPTIELLLQEYRAMKRMFRDG